MAKREWEPQTYLEEFERNERRFIWASISSLVVAIASIVLLLILMGASLARDLDGRYANSPLRAWFDHLASGKGLCCSAADGETVLDPDWDSKDGHYRVRLDGQWINVP